MADKRELPTGDERTRGQERRRVQSHSFQPATVTISFCSSTYFPVNSMAPQ